MSEKRRGLGRGLGALIPNGPGAPRATPERGATSRPVDVFFEQRPDEPEGEALEQEKAPEGAGRSVFMERTGAGVGRRARAQPTASLFHVEQDEEREEQAPAGVERSAADTAVDDGASNGQPAPAQFVAHPAELPVAGSVVDEVLPAEQPSGQVDATARVQDAPTAPAQDVPTAPAQDVPTAPAPTAVQGVLGADAPTTDTLEIGASGTDTLGADAPRVDAIVAAAGTAVEDAPVRSAPEEDVPAPDTTAQDATAPVEGVGRGSGPSAAAEPAAPEPAAPEPVGAEGAGGGDEGLVPVPGARFLEVPIAAIVPNARQPRTVFDEEELRELVHSVRTIGILQPIVVRPLRGDDGRVVEPAGDAPAYELVMGERRWRAATEAGLDVVPAIVRDTADDDLLRDALLENLHRSQLNPLEEAAAYAQLLEDFGCTHEELAERIGRSRPQISNTLRLLRLPPLVQRRLAAGVLSAGHARALLALDDGGAMERLAQRIVAEGLSVRAVEEIVTLGGGVGPTRGRRSASLPGPELEARASALADRLDTRVKITMGRSRGKLTVDFAGVEDLDRILALLQQSRGASPED